MLTIEIINMANCGSSEYEREIRRSNNREFYFLKQMESTVLSLRFVIAFYRPYWTHIPELIEELRGGVVVEGEELNEAKDETSLP
jgi:hypothetical protein